MSSRAAIGLVCLHPDVASAKLTVGLANQQGLDLTQKIAGAERLD